MNKENNKMLSFHEKLLRIFNTSLSNCAAEWMDGSMDQFTG